MDMKSIKKNTHAFKIKVISIYFVPLLSSFRYMSKSRIISLILLIGTVIVYYCYLTTSTQIIAIIVKSSTLIYKVIKMDDRKPVYKLVTIDGKKPYADGDRAQATVVKHLQLVENCKRDPSLIVVDIGAFLGNHIHCHFLFGKRISDRIHQF
jgi:hypothetical protein